MTTEMVQLERLRRHYEIAVRTYDYVSLLDLSHALRIWVELKSSLVRRYSSISIATPFCTGSPPKTLMKKLRDCIYIIAYMPGGVISYAAQGIMAAGPRITEGDDDSVHVMARHGRDGSMAVSQYYVIGTHLNNDSLKLIGKVNKKQCNYGNWLAGEVVRVSYPIGGDESKLGSLSISRENMIKRMANVYDASHVKRDHVEEMSNKFDEPVAYLHRFTCGGLPLTYFILLSISQEILKHVPRLIGVPVEE